MIAIKLCVGQKKKTDVAQPEEIKIVIQINGRKRSLISVNKNDKEQEIFNKIKQSKLVEKYINDKKIFKTIYIKDRLINIIIKE